MFLPAAWGATYVVHRKNGRDDPARRRDEVLGLVASMTSVW